MVVMIVSALWHCVSAIWITLVFVSIENVSILSVNEENLAGGFHTANSLIYNCKSFLDRGDE